MSILNLIVSTENFFNFFLLYNLRFCLQCKMALDLNELQNKLDYQLKCKTKKSLTNWLNNLRINNTIMNESNLFLSTNHPTMNSREISELTGKMHKDVLEAIRNMEPAWEKVTGRKFPLSEYTDTTGRKLPLYNLSKTECLYIATKFNDEAIAKVIVRWEQLEFSTTKLPQ